MRIKAASLIGILILSCAAGVQAVSLEDAQRLAAGILKGGARGGALPAGVAAAAGKPAQAQAPVPALQKHVAFFDQNGDGVIAVSETEQGLRRLGLGRAKANAAALVIHLFLGPKTSGQWNSMSISVKNINMGKHGSDTGVFDAEGGFVPEAFERIFAEFDANRSGSMSAAEIEAMIAANGKLRPGSAGASKQEFQLLLLIAADASEEAGGKKAPAISKARLREFYDGTLFYKLAK